MGTDSIRKAVLLGLGVNLFLVLLGGLAYAGQPEWFVKFGREGEYTPYARKVIGEDVFVALADGHDGQAYWLQARDPALLHADTEAAIFDRPAYRTQRMLYPTLAAPFRLGGEDALFWGMVIVNLVVVGLGTWATARLAVARGAPAMVGLAFALNPIVAISLLMDFGDALALAALVGTVLLLREQRYRWALACATAAVLAKEVNLLPLAAIALTGAGALPGRCRVQLLAVPALAAGLWGAYARWRFGWPPSQIHEFSVVPLRGFVDSYRLAWSPLGTWTDAIVAVGLLALAAAVVARWWRRRSLELAAALPFALLVPFLSMAVLDIWVNAIRALGPAITLLAIDWYAERFSTPTQDDRSERAMVPVR